MPDFMTRVCAFCGVQTTGFNGPVDPTNVNTPDAPPGSGWHSHAGPSYGMGMPRTDFYCSDECLQRRVINKEAPIRQTLEFEKHFHPKVPDKIANIKANPTPPGRK